MQLESLRWNWLLWGPRRRAGRGGDSRQPGTARRPASVPAKQVGTEAQDGGLRMPLGISLPRVELSHRL